MGHELFKLVEEKKERTRKNKAALAPKYLQAAKAMGCGACPLNNSKRNVPPTRRKGEGPRVYVLGRAPDDSEMETRAQFTAGAVKKFVGIMENAKLDVMYDTVVRCAVNNRDIRTMEMECCRPLVAKDLNEYDPDAIIAFGDEALVQLFGKGGGAQHWSGRRIPYRLESGKEVWCYPMMHSSSLQSDHYKGMFRLNLSKICRAIKEDPTPAKVLSPTEPKVRIVKDPNHIFLLLDAAMKADVVAFDIETANPNETTIERQLRPYANGSSIISMAIAFNDTDTFAFPIAHPEAAIEDQKDLMETIYQFFQLSKGVKVAHNLAYEMEWLSYGNPKFLWNGGPWGDTMAQAFVLDARDSVLSLDNRVLEYYGFRLKELNAHLDMGALQNEKLDDVLHYNALDAYWTYRLFKDQAKKIKVRKLEKVYDDQLDRIAPLVAMQSKGVVVDAERLQQVRSYYTKEVSQSTVYFQERNLNPNSHKQMLAHLQNESGEMNFLTATNEHDLEGYTHIDAVANLLNYRKSTKMLNTYVRPLADGKNIWPDGKVHTNYRSMHMVSRRISSSNPNMQNVPKHAKENKIFRSIFVAPKGYKLVSADYGQIEARVLAMISRDEMFNRALKEHYDIHTEWGERLQKAFPDHFRGVEPKEMRQTAKNLWVFPNFYGAGSRKIASGLRIDDVDAVGKVRKQFWDTFSGVKGWQEEVINFYNKNGYVKTLTDFIRRGPLSYTEIINTPIQSSASDIVVQCQSNLVRLAQRAEEPDLVPVMTIHDDLLFYVKEEKLDLTLEAIVDTMLSPGFSWITAPLVVEVSVGDRWDDMQDYGAHER